MKQWAKGNGWVLLNQIFILLPALGEFCASFSKVRDKSCLAGTEGRTKDCFLSEQSMGDCQRLQPKERHT